MADAEGPASGPLADHGAVLAAVRRCRVAAAAGRTDRTVRAGAVDETEPVGAGSAGSDVPGDPDDPMVNSLAALRLLGGLRSHLDEMERLLIEELREQRVSWASIAAALGLASRQAAEQRWLRLSGEATRDPARTRVIRARQRSVDEAFGVEITALRTATRAALRQLAADPTWDGRHPVAGLARRTLELAGAAAPPAMFALVQEVVRDLERMPATKRGAVGEDALHLLRAALRAATPT